MSDAVISVAEASEIRRAAARLDRILFRRNDGWRSRVETLECPILIAALRSGALHVDLTRLPAHVCEKAASGSVTLHGTEGESHARLKAAALDWMGSEGCRDAKAEYRLGRWVADAFSDEWHWVVECGNTDASRLLEAMRWSRAPRFTVIPFQPTHWQDGSVRRLLAVDFYWRPSLTRLIEAVEANRLRGAVSALEVR